MYFLGIMETIKGDILRVYMAMYKRDIKCIWPIEYIKGSRVPPTNTYNVCTFLRQFLLQ